MKRVICLALGLCLILGVFAGCDSAYDEPYVPTGNGLTHENAPPPTEGETKQALTLTYYPDKTLNPIKSTDFTNRALFPLLYQSLFVVDREYKVQPQLVKSYKVSQDMKNYIFYLEPAEFQDGSLLTAQDVVASLLAARESDYYKGRFLHISGIGISEDGGVQVTTDTSMENLPGLLDIPIIKESQIHEDMPMGTGPYTLDQNGFETRLRRRSDWWCVPYDMVVTASSITLIAATSITQIRDNFQFGGVDVVCADPGSDSYADYRCDYELWSVENGIFLYLACSKDSVVFQNDAVRKGLTHAIDRDLLAEEYYRGFARAATLPASPLFPYYDQTLASKYGFDALKFTQILNEQNLTGAEVRLLVNSDDSLRVRVAREIAAMLEECGLKVTLNTKGGQLYRYAVITRDYDLYLGQTMLSPNMDLSAFFDTYGELSYGGINDITAYTMCMEALANHGNYYTLYRTIMENGMLCPVLFRSYAVYATRGLVTGLSPARDNVFYYSLGKTMEKALIRE